MLRTAPRFLLTFLFAGSAAVPAFASPQWDAAIGGALGGGLGAAVGHQLGGRDGAIIGGAAGGGLGAAIATPDERRVEYRRSDRGYHRGHYKYKHRKHRHWD